MKIKTGNIRTVISPTVYFIILFLFFSNQVQASGFGPLPSSLKNVPTPEVPGLLDGPDPIIINKEKAILLGKALFWDINIGSDGMACASCHFHAGADTRVKNQVSPGGKSTPVNNMIFDPAASGADMGPNYTLTLDDFPLHRFADPFNRFSEVLYSSDDVVSSSGTFAGKYQGYKEFWNIPQDECERSADPVFHVGAVGTRRVEPRNAPTVINSVFSHRNFWDGRANNVFNGSSSWGDRDPDAGVWVKTNDGNIVKQRLQLINSSLASLAVAPPLSDVEMGCSQRRFADLGRKLFYQQPLIHQKVHWNDSVLGPYSSSTPGNLQPGLNTMYFFLVRQAFNPKYWSYFGPHDFGSPPQIGDYPPRPFNHLEANFAMFFALAIQLYEETLVSDDSPFDRSARDSEGLPTDLTLAELNGMQEFRFAHCGLCHIGPTFTSASIVTNAELAKTHPEYFANAEFKISTTTNVITRHLVNAGTSLNDTGFAASGVFSASADIGLGGTDPFGNPLSFSKQYLQLLAGNNAAVKDAEVMNIRPCDFQISLAMPLSFDHPRIFTHVHGILPQTQDTSGCFKPLGAFIPTPAAAAAELANPNSGKALAALNGVFKIPTLRNVELTGPFMHNGSMASLEEVLDFYIRGGNFEDPSKNFGFVFAQSDLAFSAEKRANVVAFLKTLTDDRVRYERAPFDHPELLVPHGHTGDNFAVINGHPLANSLAQDEFLVIEAVGAEGRTTPLLPFDQLLAP